MHWLKQNWFQVVVIVILIMCYTRLGKIKENTFYTADVVDSSITRISNMIEDYLHNIDRNTETTWQLLDR